MDGPRRKRAGCPDPPSGKPYVTECLLRNTGRTPARSNWTHVRLIFEGVRVTPVSVYTRPLGPMSTLTVEIATVSVYAFTVKVATATVSLKVDTNGCCNRYCTLSTISRACVDNMCIINANCYQCPILFLDIRH